MSKGEYTIDIYKEEDSFRATNKDFNLKAVGDDEQKVIGSIVDQITDALGNEAAEAGMNALSDVFNDAPPRDYKDKIGEYTVIINRHYD